MKKRFYITIEIEADLYRKPDGKEISRAIHKYLDGDGKNQENVYIQSCNTLSIMDEKGRQVN